MDESDTTAYFLQQALAQAQLRRGFCAPNPSVGAIIVKDHQILSKAHHQQAGQPHAEIEAMKTLDEKTLQEAVLYVTLEPCCHQGRTPPCTDSIIQSGIKKVVFAYSDPNPEVSGQGQKQLEEAGIECIHSPLPNINEFYRSYQFWHQHQKPWVTGKLAVSIDGMIAGEHSEPVSITGEALKQFTHERRLKADGILTTTTTIIKDNPQMNVRLNGQVHPKPLYILDSLLHLPENATIHETASRMTVFHSHAASKEKIERLTSQGILCVPVDVTEKGLDLNQILAYIGESGCHDLWVEAGGVCFESFLLNRLFHQAYVYVSLKTIGFRGLPAFRYDNLFSDTTEVTWQPYGDDVLCRICWV